MNKIFSVFSLSALVVSAVLPLHTAHAASAGDLVKCDEYSAVYYLAENGERYVFPNEQIYFSWYPDFHDVRTISCNDLATIPLGDRIVYQAGTRLVKIPSDPSVFAVEDGGVLREIPDEETAVALFGSDWRLRVDDVSEAFWSSFTVGEPLVEDEVPEGTIVENENGDLFRVEDDGTAIEVDAVLTNEQETILKEHALVVDDLERSLGVALALTRVDAASAIAVLEDLISRFRTVGIDDDAVVDVEDFDEIEDEDDAQEDAQDAIDDAEKEINKAEDDIAEDANDGRDVTASEALLLSAREKLVLAENVFATGDSERAETYADAARYDAMWARGKAVDHLEDTDGEDENQVETEIEVEDGDNNEDDSEIEDVTDLVDDSEDINDEGDDSHSNDDRSGDDRSDDDASDDDES